MTTLTGNPLEKPTVTTTRTLRLCCVFCNSMVYSSSSFDVFIVEKTQSYETSWFSVKVTAVTLVNPIVLDVRIGLGLSKSKAIFVYTVLQVFKYKSKL